jgi:hypothetical protein
LVGGGFLIFGFDFTTWHIKINLPNTCAEEQAELWSINILIHCCPTKIGFKNAITLYC